MKEKYKKSKRRKSSRKSSKKNKLTRKTSKKRKTGQNRRKKKHGLPLTSFLKEVKLFFKMLVFLLLFLVISFNLLFFIKKVNDYSMMPSLLDKERLVLKRDTSAVSRFDLVEVQSGVEDSILRVIGLPGEHIAYENDTLYVDKQPLDEKFIINKINQQQAKGMQYTDDFTLESLAGDSKIPEDYFLVLGDNRLYTTDSRQFGLVSKDRITGVVLVRIWPIDRAERF